MSQMNLDRRTTEAVEREQHFAVLLQAFQPWDTWHDTFPRKVPKVCWAIGPNRGHLREKRLRRDNLKAAFLIKTE
jgi:hypothetical protein